MVRWIGARPSLFLFFKSAFHLTGWLRRYSRIAGLSNFTARWTKVFPSYFLLLLRTYSNSKSWFSCVSLKSSFLDFSLRSLKYLRIISDDYWMKKAMNLSRVLWFLMQSSTIFGKLWSIYSITKSSLSSLIAQTSIS